MRVCLRAFSGQVLGRVAAEDFAATRTEALGDEGVRELLDRAAEWRLEGDHMVAGDLERDAASAFRAVHQRLAEEHAARRLGLTADPKWGLPFYSHG